MSYDSGAESAQLTVLGFTRSEHCSLAQRAGDQVLMVTARQGDQVSDHYYYYCWGLGELSLFTR